MEINWHFSYIYTNLSTTGHIKMYYLTTDCYFEHKLMDDGENSIIRIQAILTTLYSEIHHN